MASAAAGEPRPSGHELQLGRIDQVRVRVGYGRTPDGPAYEVFLLDLPEAGTGGTFDEMPYLEALEPILYALADRPLDYSVHVDRSRTSRGSAAGDVEIRVSLTTGSTSIALGATALDAVANAFRTVLKLAGPPKPLVLGRDEAIARAMARVEEAFPEVHSDVLSVSDEEHRAAQGSWSVGVRTRDLDRYLVVVGFLDGYAGSAHVRHEPRSEVLDAIGSESP